jgi:Domain of unknown function (DUF6431)
MVKIWFCGPHNFNLLIMLNLFDMNYSGNLKIDYKNYLEKLNIKTLVCPKCKAKGDFHKHAYYDRNIIVLEGNEIIEDKLRILRLICLSCKTTHALLPDVIIPYHIYSLSIIFQALKDKFNLKNVKTICERFNISFQLLYFWIKRFNLHKPLCEQVIGIVPLSERLILNHINDSMSNFLFKYFKEHLLFFMQFFSSG